MARKRALVVDDSKSARVILSRMLEKYDIEVDMAESAEQAIEDGRWDEANEYMGVVAQALNAYSERLDRALATF